MKQLAFRESDLRQIHFSCALAVSWEDSLIEANTPEFGRPDVGMRKTIRACKSNIHKFRLIQRRIEKVLA